ncbi:MAG: Gfo/Idh/MocA family oxidoreductase [Ruminococcaceae bacterium]|nr:Gfo/Idh/MocA family oxidoreductase [Oscillospiraceae bacterium]
MKNACIVGFGAIGPIHAKAIAETKDAKLYAICDVIEERAKKGAEQYGAKVYTDFDTMLSDKEIDVVHICTPHYLHVPMATACLSAGKNVVLEKPVVMKPEEFEILANAVENSPNKLCTMLQNRTNPCVRRLRKEMQEKDLGDLKAVCAFLTWTRDEAYYRSEEWRGKWDTEGGGVLINQAVHLIDLMSWLGGGVEQLRCNISTKYLDDIIEVEDTADAVFYMKNGTRGCFYATNAYSENSPFRLELQFEKALYRYADGLLYCIRDGQVEILENDEKPTTGGKNYWGTGHLEVIRDFYQSLETGTENYLCLKDAWHSAKVLMGMYTSAKQNGKMIQI